MKHENLSMRMKYGTTLATLKSRWLGLHSQSIRPKTVDMR